MAKSGINKDFKKMHPDWCRDAALGKYTIMDKQLREESEKKMNTYFDRIKRLHVVK